MILDLTFVGLGLGILLLAGDALVKGAVNVSLRLGIPAVLVGLTVVAFGTSAPELIVAIQAVLRDAPGLAMGNVVGSNIANILLVLGLPALIAAVPVSRADTLSGFVIMIAASLLFIALALVGPFRWPHALALLAGLALMLGDSWRRARNHRNGSSGAPGPEAEALEGVDPQMSWLKIALFLLLGIIGLPLGADLLVDGSVAIAEHLGVSDALIGLTIVAIGTSLPELATTVMAAIRREAGVVMGNIIGSNIFNLLGIIGIAGLIGPIPMPPDMLRFDIPVMLASSLLLAPFVLRGRAIGWGWGLALTAAYLIYVAVLAIRAGA